MKLVLLKSNQRAVLLAQAYDLCVKPCAAKITDESYTVYLSSETDTLIANTTGRLVLMHLQATGPSRSSDMIGTSMYLCKRCVLPH